MSTGPQPDHGRRISKPRFPTTGTLTFLAGCCLLMNGCYVTRNVWKPDHPLGYELPTLVNAPATDHLLLGEATLAINLVIDPSTLSAEERRGLSSAALASVPTSFRFVCPGSFARSAIGMVRTRDAFGTITARLTIDAWRSPAIARLDLGVPLRTATLPASWIRPTEPTYGAMVLPERMAEPLGRGLERLALVTTGQSPAWREPSGSNPRLAFLGWQNADGTPSSPLTDLDDPIDDLVAQRRFAELPDIRLICSFERLTMIGVAVEGYAAVPLLDIIALGLLDQAGDEQWTGLDPADVALGDDAIQVPGAAPIWVHTLLKIPARRYEIERTAGRVIMTPGCLVVDGLCWTFATCTFPLWGPFHEEYQPGGGGGGVSLPPMARSIPMHR